MRRWIVLIGVTALLLIVVMGAGAAVIYGNRWARPASVQVDAGVPATFELHNAGQSNHNFTSTDLNVSTGPGPGTS
jgi:hypothetical protein